MTIGRFKSERPPVNVPSEKKQLPPQLEEFRRALEEEIETIEKNGLSSTLLRKGTQIKNNGASRWYEFAVDYMPVMPADTPCKLIVGKNNYEVSVISATEHTIILASSTTLPPSIEQARLENGATVLMERLIKRIEDNSTKTNSAASRLLDYSDPGQKAPFETIYLVKSDDLILNGYNNEAQTRAVISALTNNVTYIWGPPGTGKTSVIAQIIHNLYRNERSVLLISHTNTAVDGAIAKVDKEYGYCYQKTSPYPLLRLGKAFQELPERLGLEAHIEELGKDLYARKSEIEQQELQDKQKLSEIETLLSKNEWLNKNRLQEACNLMERMERLEAELLPAQERLSEAEMLYQREMEAHPEYEQQYQDLSRCLETERQYVKESEEKLLYSLETLATLPEQLRHAQSEISVHQKREELEKQKAQSLSSAALEKYIQTHQYDIAQLEEQEKNNRSEYHALQQSILEHARKSNIAKLFANKSKIEQARERIVVLEQRYNDICAQKINKQKALDEYQKKLSALCEINRQLSVLHITNTKDYWINVVSNLQAIEESIRLDLPQLDADYQYAQQKFHQALEKLDRLKTVHELIESKLQILKTCREELAVIQKQKNDCFVPYSAIVEQEINVTNAWRSPVFESANYSPKECCVHLVTVEETVRSEIVDIDLEALQKEKAFLKEQLQKWVDELKEIQQQLAGLERECILQAKVVGTTLAKSYLNDILHERTFDTVILDEASMASIPALWCACLLAEKNIVIVGDFLQLSPIVIASTPTAQKWLGRDIFDLSGMQERIKGKKHPSERPDNFIVLDHQYRMESEIAEIANMYYGKYCRLRSDDQLPHRIKERNMFYEWYGGKQTRNPIHLLDTANFHAWVTGVKQAKGHSRLNFFSAAFNVTLAFSLIEQKITECLVTRKPAKNPAVLIVAPYKPHVKLIEQYIEAQYSDILNKLDKQSRSELGCTDLGLVKVGTIHQFQGSEAEIVIFDLVIDEPHWRANLFMNEPEVNAELQKMFNVAVTRAKFKLYIVGNFDYCRKRAKDNALGELLEHLIRKQKLPILDAKEMFPRLTFAQPKYATVEADLENKVLTCTESVFSDYLVSDLQLTQRRAIIFSPFMTESRLSQLLPVMNDCINRGCEMIVITKALSERGKKEVEQYKKCEDTLRAHGIHVIYKQGMHEKNIFIDQGIVWNGSLNALSFSGTTGEVMQRFCDKGIYEQFANIFDLEQLIAPCVDSEQQKCPLCAGTMLAAESSDGGFYWTCDQCDYSRNPLQPYPTDGVLRCAKCQSSFVFDMKKQPRWVCAADSKHYQAIRAGDLKLPKMLQLIPTKRYAEVNAYFKEKTGKTIAALDAKPQKQQRRPLLQLDDNNVVIKEYAYLADAIRETGINSKSIRDAANGAQTHAGGYRWKYKDDV